MKKKILLSAIVALSVALLVAVGGTMAWLIDTSGDVVNTFTPTDVDIELSETIATPNNLPMVPGNTIAKDPKVTVYANSEKCYVFVKIVESGTVTVDGVQYSFDDYLEYAIATGWNEMSITTDTTTHNETVVLWRVVDKASNNQPFAVLANDQVTVKNTVTKQMMKKYTDSSIKLTFTAYAVQYDNVYDSTKTDLQNAGAAWAIAAGSNANPAPVVD